MYCQENTTHNEHRYDLLAGQEKGGRTPPHTPLPRTTGRATVPLSGPHPFRHLLPSPPSRRAAWQSPVDISGGEISSSLSWWSLARAGGHRVVVARWLGPACASPPAVVPEGGVVGRCGACPWLPGWLDLAAPDLALGASGGAGLPSTTFMDPGWSSPSVATSLLLECRPTELRPIL